MAIDKLSGNSFATGAIANSLGYTPANKAGDTFTGAVTFSNTVAIGSDYISPYIGFKNRIINGAMVIDQRNAGAATTTHISYPVDRWVIVKDTSAGSFTIQQSNTAPAGFAKSLVFTVGTAYTPSSGENNFLKHLIEGFNVADLNWGSANAATVTLSFWVRSSLTGTFGGSVRNGSSNRSYPFSYTISAANTFEYKTITITGDTTGTWNTTNGTGVEISWGLSVGSTYSGTANAWVGSNIISTTGATNLTSTAGATFYITGVQLEKGSTATSFDYRDFGRELIMCQRYYEKSFDYSTAPTNGVYSQAVLANVPYADQWVLACPWIPFKVPKRTAPTISFYGTTSNQWQVNNNSNGWDNFASIGTSYQGTNGIWTNGFSVSIHNNGNSGYTTGYAKAIRGDWTAIAEL